MNDLQQEVFFQSSGDDSMQPALLQRASSTTPRPLVVALHTWSYDHLSCNWENYRTRAAARDWHLIYPKFRGPNCTPEACGSDLVVSDIVSAAKFAVAECNVDPERIYLIGGSGGGHASLLTAGRHPELWTAVSSWCPIFDLTSWHSETAAAGLVYAEHIEAACGGNPALSPQARSEALKRSPVSYLSNARGKVTLDINTGIHDGHTGSVPVSHSIRAFNMLAAESDRIREEDIAFIVSEEKVPVHLQFRGIDPAYGSYKVLLRKTSGTVRLTLFEGGHDILAGPGIAFLENNKMAAEPVWNSGKDCDLDICNTLSK